jgi:hypothetical protein
MIIIVKNIRASVSSSDLHDFVEPVLKRSFPFRSGRIVKTEILILREKETNSVEYHGLVYVNSDAAARRAVVKLRGKRLANKAVSVKEYFIRDWHNDRRVRHTADPANYEQKRVADRRRNNRVEVIENTSNMFLPVDAARKLI